MNNIYISLLAILALICGTSCNNGDPDIFSDSSANRTEQARKANNELLCSAENGWVMEYFTTTNEEGYIFIMKFDKNGSVKIAAKNRWINNKYSEESSLFEVIADNGPVLTFNSYNNLFHIFSTPEDIEGTDENENGRGHLGDYEFVIIAADQNTFTLKGKKHGEYAYLRRLEVGQDWQNYYAKLEEMDKKLFSSKISNLFMTIGDEKFVITNAAAHVMKFVPEGGDPISETDQVPFLITPDGIRFMNPFKGKKDAFSIQTFSLTENGGLICKEDGVTTIVAPALSDLIIDKTMKWRFDATQLGGKYVKAYADVVAECKSEYKEDFQYFEIGYDGKTGSRIISFKSGKYTGMLYTDITSASTNNVTMTYKGSGDKTANAYLKKCPAFTEFMNLLSSSEFELESTSAICPTTVKFISKADKNDYFIVDVQ